MNEMTPVTSTPHAPAVIPEPTGITIFRNPDSVLHEASIAANALKKMIDQTGSSIVLGNSEHIKFEAWQTVGTFFNVTVRSSGAIPCEIHGVQGAKAQADLIDNATGTVIGGGEAYCMRDEPNWKNKPWFQLASMAQTRASSKALANKFRWVSVLAGYAPTPAEEMEDEGDAPKMRYDMATKIHNIQDFLSKICEGNKTMMDQTLKAITRYTDKAGVDKWVTFENLESIAQRKPEWIDSIFKKCFEAYERFNKEKDAKKSI